MRVQSVFSWSVGVEFMEEEEGALELAGPIGFE